MNEFTEKLIERLEEEYNYQKAKSFEEGIRVGAGEEPKMVTEERSRYRNAQCFDASILIVKELAKEYNGGCCEWKKYENDIIFPYKTSCGNSDLYDDSYKFCPYCGKEIKVVE